MIEIMLNSRNGNHHANDAYNEGNVIAKRAARKNGVDSFERLSIDVKELRDNPGIIGDAGLLKKDISFLQP